jgi:hypothetical protein
VHEVNDPEVPVKVPAAQVEHAIDAEAEENRPELHEVHDCDPAAAVEPGKQAVHVVEVVNEYRPAAQLEQVDDPEPAEYLPPGQLEQLVDPIAAAKKPAKQVEHVAAAASL